MVNVPFSVATVILAGNIVVTRPRVPVLISFEPSPSEANVQAPFLRIVLICAFTIAAAIAVGAQSRGQRPRYPSQTKPPASRPTPPPVEDNEDVQEPQEVLKTDTSLVTVPVIAV